MALAAILNPVDKNEALVFYYSKKDDRYNLAVNSISLVGGSDVLYNDLNTSDGGFNLPPSDIAVAQYLGQIRVHGIARMPRTPTSPGNLVPVVAQLSPTRNPIDKPSESLTQPGQFSAISACGAHAEGYVSYLKEIEGDINLVYYIITKSKRTPRPKTIGAADYSKLASYIVDGSPWVFFQPNKDHHISYYDLKLDESKKIATTNACARGSHIAITHSDSKTKILFVYYRNISNHIARVYRSGKKWSAEEVVSQHAIDDDSAIAVVVHEDSIHAFFWSQGEIVHQVTDVPDESTAAEDEA